MEKILIYLIAFIIGYIIYQLLYTKNNFRVGGQFKFSKSEYKTIFKDSYDDYKKNTEQIMKDFKDSYHEDYCKKNDQGIHYNLCNVISDVASKESLKKLKSTKTSVCNIKNKVVPDKFKDLCKKIDRLLQIEKTFEDIITTDTIKEIYTDINTLKKKIDSKSNADEKTLIGNISDKINRISDTLEKILQFKTITNDLKTISNNLICGDNSLYASQFKNMDKLCNSPVKEIDFNNINTECKGLLNDKDFKKDYINCDKK